MKTNSITIVGYVGKNPEMKEFNDKQVTKFSVAHNGSDPNNAQWFTVDCWDYALAETVIRQIEKGSRVRVTGSLKVNRYQKKNGGGEDFQLVIKLESFKVLPRQEKAA
jgi:single stranded DNA-binding protein